MNREEWRTRAIDHGTELRKVKEQLEIAIATLELYALEKMYLRDNKSGIVFEFENLGNNRANDALKEIKRIEDKYNEPGNHN